MTQIPISNKITPKLEYTIRPAIDSDIPILKWSHSDWNSYYQEKWEQKIDGRLDMYVAVINDFPIAHLWLDWTKYGEKSIGQISSFVVSPPFRGLGIGKTMMNFAENILIKKGLKTAETGTDKSNNRAKKLYERLGYKTVGEKQGNFTYTTESGEVMEYTEDCWVMQKKLV